MRSLRRMSPAPAVLSRAPPRSPALHPTAPELGGADQRRWRAGGALHRRAERHRAGGLQRDLLPGGWVGGRAAALPVLSPPRSTAASGAEPPAHCPPPPPADVLGSPAFQFNVSNDLAWWPAANKSSTQLTLDVTDNLDGTLAYSLFLTGGWVGMAQAGCSAARRQAHRLTPCLHASTPVLPAWGHALPFHLRATCQRCSTHRSRPQDRRGRQPGLLQRHRLCALLQAACRPGGGCRRRRLQQ